jgi:hypothetical protein
VSAHKIIYRVVRNKEKGVILKLDYEKAYDRVSWQFLEELLVIKGLGKKCIEWVLSLAEGGGGSISIRIIDENISYFKLGKGLWQGDMLSPCSLIW